MAEVLEFRPGVFVGSLAIVLGALSWSVGIVYSRRSHLSGHPLLLSALSLLAGSLQLLLVGTAVGEYRGFSFASVSLRSWLALGYLILFGSVVAFTAYNWLLEHYSPTLVATHTYVNPSSLFYSVGSSRARRHFKCAPLRRPGHWRSNARRSRDDTTSAQLLEFSNLSGGAKIKKARPIAVRAF